MSLRKKFLQKILPPLLFGILITSVISTTFLLNFSLKIVDDNSENILSAEYSSIKSVSDSLALGMSEFFHSKLSSLEGLLNLAENINLEASNKMIITNKTLLNAYKISTNEENIRLYPDFIEKWNVTMSRSMWYKDSDTLDIAQLSDSERKNLEFARLLEPSLRSIYGSTISLSSIYILFMETGLQFIYPAMIRDRYLNYKSKRFCQYTNSKQTEYFDMRCLGSTAEGIEFLNNGFLNTTMFVSRPFYMFDYNHVQLSMCGVHYSNLTNKNFSLISAENRKIEFFICGDYILKDLDNMLYGITASHKGYYYIVNSFGYVFYHPTFGIKDFFNDNRTIYDYEFDENDDENQKNKEILEFKQNVVPLIEMFYQIQNKTVDLTQIIPKIRYTKNKEEMIGTVSPIFFPITYSFLKYHGCSVIFVENIKIVLDNFSLLKDKTYRLILVQSIGFFIVILLLAWIGFTIINYLVNSIIMPIRDLSEVVHKMLNDDLDTDVTRNYTPNSEEINQLYQSFSKLKFVMKYANAEFFSGNDAQALINYSNALQLYQEINNRDGIGMTYNNIGNIHLKNKRYEESIHYYRLAVKIIEEDLNFIYKDNTFFRNEDHLINVSISSDSTIKKPLFTQSRRNREKVLKTKKNQVISEQTIRNMNEQYSNRLYQLGLTLFTQMMFNDKEEGLSEMIEIFEKVIEIDSSLGLNPARIIQSLIYLSNIYLELGNHVASLKYLNEAETSVYLYEKAQQMVELDQKMIKTLRDSEECSLILDQFHNTINKFDIKSDILKQLLMYHFAIFCKKMGKNKEACLIFTKTLETGKIYDPLIRKKCLEDLSYILASQGLLSKAPNVTMILNRLDSLKEKEIMFLLDVSQSMGMGPRLKYALKNFLKIFDRYLRGEDKIGFMRFNLNCEIVFGLTKKKQNTFQLRRHIESTYITEGTTALFDALMIALDQFSIENNNSVSNRWIVCLTDGEDTYSQHKIWDIREKIKKINVNLIIVGMGLPLEFVNPLSELCKTTKDGVFIESPNNDDLDIAFEAISQIVYGPNFIVETFSFA